MWGDTKPAFSDSAEQGLHREPDLNVKVAGKQVNCDRVEGFNVLLEGFQREAGISFNDINYNWAPGGDISLLGLLIQLNISPYNVGTQAKSGLVNHIQ